MELISKFKKSFYDKGTGRNYGNWVKIEDNKVIYTNGYYITFTDIKNPLDDGVYSVDLIPLEGVYYPKYEDVIQQSNEREALPVESFKSFEKLGRNSKKGFIYYSRGLGFFNSFDKIDPDFTMACFDAGYISKIFKFLEAKSSEVKTITFCKKTSLLHIQASDAKAFVDYYIMAIKH